MSEKGSEQVTLGVFIEDNWRLLSCLGVFAGLTMFASNMPLKFLGAFLGFLFICQMLLILWEIIDRFPSGEVSERLHWFHTVLSGVVLVVVGYWFVAYVSLWRLVLPFVLGAIGMVVSVRVLRRLKLGGRKVRWVAGYLFLTVGYAVGVLVTEPVGTFLEELRVGFGGGLP